MQLTVDRVPVTEAEREGCVYLDGIGSIRWHPRLGRFLDGKLLFAGVFDNEDPLMIHIYAKPNNKPFRALNLGAHRVVGDALVSACRKRYAAGQYKVEYYDPRVMQPLIGDDRFPHLFCAILTEPLFSRNEKERNQLIADMDAALASIKD